MPVHAYIAWAPHDEGLRAALLYAAGDTGVIGWFARERNRSCSAAYFLLEGACRAPDARFRRSAGDDIDGCWLEPAIPPPWEVACPLAPADRRRLARLRAAFAAHWFFRGDDSHDLDEIEAYRSEALPLHALNVRTARFRRFERRRRVWVHASPAIDFETVLCVKDRFPEDRREARVLP